MYLLIYLSIIVKIIVERIFVIGFVKVVSSIFIFGFLYFVGLVIIGFVYLNLKRISVIVLNKFMCGRGFKVIFFCFFGRLFFCKYVISLWVDLCIDIVNNSIGIFKSIVIIFGIVIINFF